MDLYLYREWADVLASELVSIALISADGLHVFYAESAPFRLIPCRGFDPWCIRCWSEGRLPSIRRSP